MAYPKDDAGNVRVDFAWGNIPPQPNELRSDQGTTFGGGAGDQGWDSTYYATSDTLDTTVTAYVGNPTQFFNVPSNHLAYVEGYQNFPEYLPNYAGDGDSGLEVIMPDLRGLTRAAAQTAATAARLGTLDVNYVTYDILNVTSAAKVVTVTTDGNHLLKAKDVVSVVYNDGDGFSGTWANVTITSVTANTFKFSLATAPAPALNFTSTGYVYSNPGIILDQEIAAGDTANISSTVSVISLNGD